MIGLTSRLAVGATAVHLGREDLPPKVARQILGSRRRSSAARPTRSKRQSRWPNSLLTTSASARCSGRPQRAIAPRRCSVWNTSPRSARRSTSPSSGLAASPQGASRDVLAAGAYGVAVLSAVVCRDDPQAACREFAEGDRAGAVMHGFRRLDSDRRRRHRRRRRDRSFVRLRTGAAGQARSP